jgi:hypothetical protein
MRLDTKISLVKLDDLVVNGWAITKNGETASDPFPLTKPLEGVGFEK